MKNILMLTSVILFYAMCNSLFAQDVLLLKSGEELKVIVNEISTNVIKYKKFENPDGPIYVIEKVKVVMITYKNGSKDVFSEIPTEIKTEQRTTEPKKELSYLTAKRGIVRQNGIVIRKNEVRSIMTDNSNALNLYNSSQKLILVGDILGYAGLGVVIVAAIVENKGSFSDNSAAMVGVIGGVACLGTSMVVTFSGRSKVKKSVEMYNSDLKKYSSYEIGVGITGNGIALVINF